ncbi:hypothetical protein ABUK73_06365 [Agrobacterium sp. BA1120]|uniref:hypothetical protein n=1 Tax=Agrobacterium sp. BA1120 TaxID=3228927 RepID=UPI00336ADA8D
MRERIEEAAAMEFVADHATGLIEMLRSAEESSNVHIVTYLLAAARDQALSATTGKATELITSSPSASVTALN